VQRLLEPYADSVSGPVTEVLEHEKEQAAVELDVEDDVCVSRDGLGHVVSLAQPAMFRRSRP
jgi:hypothetical protein